MRLGVVSREGSGERCYDTFASMLSSDLGKSILKITMTASAPCYAKGRNLS
jgi:hypothetical protein